MNVKSLEVQGEVSTDTETDNSGDYEVHCPRCGHTEDGLTRSEACRKSNQEGCPNCEQPQNERYDLQTDTVTGPYSLTDVGGALAVRKA